MSSQMLAVVGPMFAGKSEELLRLIKREKIARRKVLVIKPYVDTRTEAFIASRAIDESGGTRIVESCPALVIHDDAELWAAVKQDFDTLVIDEAQFFQTPGFMSVIKWLLVEKDAKDLLVIVAGLDTDYRMEPFGPMPQLQAIAANVTRLAAICMKCFSRGARLTQRIRGTEEQVQVGDSGDYEVRCLACHEPDLVSTKAAP